MAVRLLGLLLASDTCVWDGYELRTRTDKPSTPSRSRQLRHLERGEFLPLAAYFPAMVLRVMRALDYVTSRPEWSRQDLLVQGTFQDGLQAS